MSSIKFSIIIPVYNVEKYLNECVESVINQTYSNFEIILVDDGSTDSSPKICDSYVEKDNRIKVIHKKNGGLSSARNVGIKNMTGDYVLFLDSDDFWDDKSLLSSIDEVIRNYGSDVIILGYRKFYDEKRVYVNGYDTTTYEHGKTKAEQVKSLISNNLFESSAWSKIVNTKLFRDDRLFFTEGVYSEDIDWSARLLIYADSFYALSGYGLAYRQNSSSITHNIKKKNIEDLKNAIVKIVNFSAEIDDQDYYEWFMNYCSYQYITFLNCICSFRDSKQILSERKEMQKYVFLLNYHSNQKVKKVYFFHKIFGFKGMLIVLNLYLKLRG
ncbi:glycosyltransferase family 2 protein [Ruminococcus sp.]|uniref:glycosyltransferase family 2 protein n=1 Tax=Ruminococcus sp. TaxID=41978 RepID=UPI003F0FA9C1